VDQLTDALDGAPAGPLIVAYEPVWAIGAPEPAPVEHIRTVTRALRGAVADRPGTFVIYGGSAGPRLLTQIGDAADGLFLGRFAHDPLSLETVLDEAAVLAIARAEGLGR
jgi:triosephosphate isomerase